MILVTLNKQFSTIISLTKKKEPILQKADCEVCFEASNRSLQTYISNVTTYILGSVSTVYTLTTPVQNYQCLMELYVSAPIIIKVITITQTIPFYPIRLINYDTTHTKVLIILTGVSYNQRIPAVLQLGHSPPPPL